MGLCRVGEATAQVTGVALQREVELSRRKEMYQVFSVSKPCLSTLLTIKFEEPIV